MSKMKRCRIAIENLENRRLLAWSGYAQLVNQDDAASNFSSITGKGVTVAVIDTGVDYNLSQLGGGFGAGHKVVAGYDIYANDSDPMDESGHGTNVAGVIAASSYKVGNVTYQGVAPDAKLVALRVGTETNISNRNIERALQWVINNYSTYGISVVNLSLGSGSYTDSETSSQFSDEFQKLHDLGIFVTAASGNSNDSFSGPISADGIAYPAADPNVFAVAAVDSSDVISTWSQRGDELDLLAPGVDIVALKKRGGTEPVDGTSFASPYVAGAAALIKQLDSTARAGDIGSILMSSGTNNRDGAGEIGNTTSLQFSRLDINAALKMTQQRLGKYASMDMGTNFDTALDAQGVLHAAWYDTGGGGRLMYATRDTDGLWSAAVAVDSNGDVGAMPSIAVDTTGKVGIGYFDLTNTGVKFASFNGTSWSSAMVEDDKHVGTNPSLEFDIDGNAYLAYYKRSGGNLRLAILNRDAGTWSRSTVDGADGTDVGADLSLDVAEVAVRGGFGFTVYDTAVAIAYSDSTNGDLKYARLDLDDPTATWYRAVVADGSGVSNINLDLHGGPTGLASQAQIIYQDNAGADVKYAYRNTDWFVETVASTGKLGDVTGFYFDDSDNPIAVYYDRDKKALYASQRAGDGTWSKQRVTTAAAAISVAKNERTGSAALSWLNRPKTDVFSSSLI
jgi:hypothetical protein